MLNIVYEDNDIIVINKPHGIAVQTAQLAQQDLVSMVKKHIASNDNVDQIRAINDKISSANVKHSKTAQVKTDQDRVAHLGQDVILRGAVTQKMLPEPYLGVVHRLDQPVSGLVLFAKNEKAAAELSKQFSSDAAGKEYIALVAGAVSSGQHKLVDYIVKLPRDNMAKIVQKGTNGAKRAELEYTAADNEELKLAEKIFDVNLDEMDDVSVILVKLNTGRFHQIRVQLSNEGHPLICDVKYGGKRVEAFAYRKGFIALCAYKLAFVHPTKKERMTFML